MKRDAVQVNGFAGRQRRLDLGLTQTAVADLIITSRAFMSMIESGKRENMTLGCFYRWVAALELDDHRVVLANPHLQRLPDERLEVAA